MHACMHACLHMLTNSHKCNVSYLCQVFSFTANFMDDFIHTRQGIVMFFVKRSLSHVRKLHIDDLSAKKITARTVRCGGIARKCPCWSRWLFFFMTVGVVS
ncbi:unnamed protein product, partial [Symbiodinium sp. CCMP2456]